MNEFTDRETNTKYWLLRHCLAVAKKKELSWAKISISTIIMYNVKSTIYRKNKDKLGLSCAKLIPAELSSFYNNWLLYKMSYLEISMNYINKMTGASANHDAPKWNLTWISFVRCYLGGVGGWKCGGGWILRFYDLHI